MDRKVNVECGKSRSTVVSMGKCLLFVLLFINHSIVFSANCKPTFLPLCLRNRLSGIIKLSVSSAY